MRGVTKGKPPKNVNRPDLPHRSLTVAQQQLKAGLLTASHPAHHARDEHFDMTHKPTLSAGLAAEQRGICVFCENRVRPGTGTIDHWIALSEEPGRALEWKNLYLSCPTKESCNAFKLEKSMGSIPRPCDCRLEDHVGFTSGGEIYAKDGPYREALEAVLGTADEPKVLNLNGRTQRAARAAAIDQLKQEIAGTGRSLPLEQRQAVAAKLLARNPLPAYVGAQVAWVLWETGARPG